jgi:ABC-type transport system involved in multi-copper enzyme maturation permease subunit
VIARAGLFVQRELAGSLRARWFLAYSAVFLAGGLLFAVFGMGDLTIYGFRGFAKAFTGLVHLSLLFVPLLALFPAAASVAEDRESGALEYMLAQPVTFGEVYAGKLGGVSVAILLSLTVGFGVAGAVAVLRGVPPLLLVTLYGYVVLLALVFVALGLCFSTITASRARAMTLGILVWLAMAALGTLGVMVAFVRWGLPESLLVWWSFVNPVEAFRLGVVSALDADLSLLGPVGAGVVSRFGAGGTMALAAVSLAAWAALPALAGWRVFRHRG